MSSQKSYSSELKTATAKNPLLPEKLQEAFNGFQLTQALYVTAKLDLADHINKKNDKSCKELAKDVGADVTVLHQLMELLLTLGVVAKDNNDNYQLTQMGSLLRSDNPDSVLGFVLSTAQAYPAWGNLLYSVQTGKAGFDQAFQMNFYEYLAQNIGANKHFNQWMEESTRDWIIPVLEKYDFSMHTHFVDIGGGTGILTAGILTRYPDLQASIFDQDHVIDGARKVLESAGVNHRCHIIAGDFFKSIPVKGDLYIVSRVLLNWNDDHAFKILKNCCAAMDHSDRLLIIDFMLPNKNITASDLLSSLHLQVIGGNLMRTKDEFYTLISKAGFHSLKMIQTEGAIHFIEAVPK